MVSPKSKSTHLCPNSVMEIFLIHLAFKKIKGITAIRGKIYKAVIRLKFWENVLGSNSSAKDWGGFWSSFEKFMSVRGKLYPVEYTSPFKAKDGSYRVPWKKKREKYVNWQSMAISSPTTSFVKMPIRKAMNEMMPMAMLMSCNN